MDTNEDWYKETRFRQSADTSILTSRPRKEGEIQTVTYEWNERGKEPILDVFEIFPKWTPAPSR